jgi:hypothetical protein
VYLKPAAPIEGSSAVELWDGKEHAATIYAQRAGLQVICEPGWEPGYPAIDVQEPSVQFGIVRQRD